MTRTRKSPAAAAATPLTARKRRNPFLPYQLAWMNDDSPAKLGDKSRRTGWTWCEAYDAVSRRAAGKLERDYWFSSADESAAAEFIEYCRWWHKDLFTAAADYFTEEVEDEQTRRTATAFCVRFPTCKIVAMTSNPRRFRSKGGDVGLDEFGFHDQAREMFTAAAPVTTWGGTLRVFSTPNGEFSEFNRLVQRARKLWLHLGRDPDAPRVNPPTWAEITAAADALKVSPAMSYHRVTIDDAIAQGIVERIAEQSGRALTREEFRAECRRKALDEEAFAQEYLCVPSVGNEAWLTYALIEACEHVDCPGVIRTLRSGLGRDGDGTYAALTRLADAAIAGRLAAGYTGQRCTIGVDVGRTRDLTVAWVVEWVGDVAWTRAVVEIEKTPLPEQQRVIDELLRHYKVSAVSIDQTGIGLGLCEYLRAKHGSRIEGVTFTPAAKQGLAVTMKQMFEDRRVRIPADDGVLRDDLRKVRKIVNPTTQAVRFDAERDAQGHADRFWAAALALEAGKAGRGSGIALCGYAPPKPDDKPPGDENF